MTESSEPRPQGRALEDDLRKQPAQIRTEETPERLLVLARRLQDLLRQRETPD